MSLYFTQDNDDELKKYYKFTLESQSAEENNTYLRVLFGDRLSELNILEKFKEFKEKFKHYQGKMRQQMSTKSFMMKLFMNIMILYINLIKFGSLI